MIIREVFVKLLLDSFGKLSIRSHFCVIPVRGSASTTYSKSKLEIEKDPISIGGYWITPVLLMWIGRVHPDYDIFDCEIVDSLLITSLNLFCYDISEANGIIRDLKLELENSRFTFDLVPLSYESFDVVVGENWLLRHKAGMACHKKVVKIPYTRSDADLRRLVSFDVFRKVRGGVRDAREMIVESLKEGRCNVKFFQQLERSRGSYLEWKNSMGNEPDLGNSEGAAQFRNVVWLGPTSVKRDREWFILVRQGLDLHLERCKDLGYEQARRQSILIHPGAVYTMVFGVRLTNRWLSMKKDIASCDSKYLAYSEVEVEYQGSSGLLLQLKLRSGERITKDVIVKLPSLSSGYSAIWV
ncbi:putative reverse transcriptase domain-containing protein [Tanacetum coccineum]|uniref:Reverse transcriptase domain-containing protein n=1 Tax=Tanacetum coccineum TaxID=301880 RepID=A0ABQ5CDP3_9ASTR